MLTLRRRIKRASRGTETPKRCVAQWCSRDLAEFRVRRRSVRELQSPVSLMAFINCSLLPVNVESSRCDIELPDCHGFGV